MLLRESDAMAGPPTEFDPVPPDVAARPTVKLPRRSASRRVVPRRRAPVWVAATVTTLWAALVSYVPVLALVGLLTQVGGGPPVVARIRFGTAVWLLRPGAPPSLGGGRGALGPRAGPGPAARRGGPRPGPHPPRPPRAR